MEKILLGKILLRLGHLLCVLRRLLLIQTIWIRVRYELLQILHLLLEKELVVHHLLQLLLDALLCFI